MLQYPDRNGTIQVWDSGALSPQIASPRPKLTPAALSGRCAGAVEREDERLQREHQFGGVFPGRDQDCVRIGRRDDQSLGFGCARTLKIAAPWPRLTLAGLFGRQTGTAEREDERPQRLRHVGGVFA